jgi:cell wall assembly regulator SMI1
MTHDDDLSFMQQALDDLVEWFEEQGLHESLKNLRPGADDEALEPAAATLGAPLSPALAALYRWHDGQQREPYPIFEELFFSPLATSLKVRPGMLLSWFNDGDVRPDALFLRPGDALLPDELNDLWLPIADADGTYITANVRSGRVWLADKSEGRLRLLADSVPQWLGEYASALWDDHYCIAGDPKLPGVEQQGFLYLMKHLARR